VILSGNVSKRVLYRTIWIAQGICCGRCEHNSVLPAIPPTTAISSTTTAFAFRPCLVYVQFTAAELATVEACDGFFAIVVAGHLDKSETARTAGVAVGEDTNPLYLPVGREQLTQLIFCGIEAEVADEYVLHANAPQLIYLSVGDPAAK
jgi:hypothetical protein